MTVLDTRVKLYFPGHLHPELVMSVRTLPGVGYGTKERPGKGTLYVPYNAYGTVAAVLASWRVTPSGLCALPNKEKTLPPHPEPWTEKTLIARSLVTEAHDWLWDDTPPTAGATFRVLPFQREALQHVCAWGGGHLWQPGGSGKTVEGMIWALMAPGPVVIVTRAAARETQRREWVRCSSCEPYVIKPASEIRKRDQWHSLAEYLADRKEQRLRPVVVVGWEMLTTQLGDLIAMGPAAVIFDESHRAKAPKRTKWIIGRDGRPQERPLSNTSASAATLARVCQRRLCTTASAIRHRTWDLWGQLTLVEPDAWGKTATKFLYRYCDARMGQYGIIATGLSNAPELLQRLAFTVHKTPHHVTHAQLPAKRRTVAWIPLSEQVQPHAWNLKKDERDAAKQRNTTRLTEIKMWRAASAKRGAVVKQVKEDIRDTERGKVLVITGRRRDCDKLGEMLTTALAKGNGPLGAIQVWYAHGGTSQEERQRIQDEYMAHQGPCVLVGTIDAWGESLNLQDTDVMDVAMLPYTPGQLDQLEHRVHRLGQNRPVLIRYMVAEDTIDEHVAQILLSKLPAVETVVGSEVLGNLGKQLQGIENRDEVLAGILDAFSRDDE